MDTIPDETLLLLFVIKVLHTQRALRAQRRSSKRPLHMLDDDALEAIGFFSALWFFDYVVPVVGLVAIFVLSREKQLAVLGAVTTGSSVRATEKMTGVNRDTIIRHLRIFGARALWLHDERVRGLACANVEVDEQHSFVFVKQGHRRPEHRAETGDTWSWSAIDRKSRLAIAFYVGKRTEESSDAFIADLRSRLVMMPQISSDGFGGYRAPIAKHFGAGVSYASVVKAWPQGRRRRPDDDAPSLGVPLVKSAILGEPDLGAATTSHNERVNLTMRQNNARLHRRTLAFSKTLASHEAAVALQYVAYNFCNVVRTTKKTPAMGAGLGDHPWKLYELLDVLMSTEPVDPPAPVVLRARVAEPLPLRAARRTREAAAPYKPMGQLELFERQTPT